MISIIIPVLNEATTIRKNLSRILSLSGDYEVIVVDGGSSDDTVNLASSLVTVVTSEKGRGRQMNTGAKSAKGDIFWFVHSDSIISSDSIQAIEMAIKTGHQGGCFSLYFHDSHSFNLKWLAFTSNLRAKYLHLMFGDQGIFVKRQAFEALDGFPEYPIMEDWAFSKMLTQKYSVSVLSEAIGTSGRRFKEGGFFKTLLKMHYIKWKYIRGTSPNELIKLYKEIR